MHVHQAINEHGEDWRDYLSIGIDDISEFDDQKLPGLNDRTDYDRIARELRGAGGIPGNIAKTRQFRHWLHGNTDLQISA